MHIKIKEQTKNNKKKIFRIAIIEMHIKSNLFPIYSKILSTDIASEIVKSEI